jgi:hypothetical protein
MNPAVIQIDPKGVYDDDLLYLALGLSARTLARARRDCQLKFTRKGNRTFYLGEWVLDWLTAGAERKGVTDGSR